jgi:F-type H+-transporting ATPase subunit a
MTTNGAAGADLIQQKTDAVQRFIMHHLQDSNVLPFFGWEVPLPSFLSAHGVMVVFSGLILVLLIGRLYRPRAAAPRGWTNALELFVQFIRDQIAVPFLGASDGIRMTPMLCSLFFFILTMNLVGLIPCFQSATADVSVTAALAIVVLAFMVFGAVWRHGAVGFVKGFIPHGVPWPILIVLVPIEMLGLLIKAFALTIRLFANEFAGHVVVFFLLGLVVIFGAAGIPFIVMGLLVYILEIGVAFLQAYIFTLLSAIFIGQRLHPEH